MACKKPLRLAKNGSFFGQTAILLTSYKIKKVPNAF